MVKIYLHFTSHSTQIQPTFNQIQPNSTNIQPTFNQIQPTFNQHSTNIQPTFNHRSTIVQPSFNHRSTIIQPSFNHHSTNIQPTFNRIFTTSHHGFTHPSFIISVWAAWNRHNLWHKAPNRGCTPRGGILPFSVHESYDISRMHWKKGIWTHPLTAMRKL